MQETTADLGYRVFWVFPKSKIHKIRNYSKLFRVIKRQNIWQVCCQQEKGRNLPTIFHLRQRNDAGVAFW